MAQSSPQVGSKGLFPATPVSRSLALNPTCALAHPLVIRCTAGSCCAPSTPILPLCCHSDSPLPGNRRLPIFQVAVILEVTATSVPETLSRTRCPANTPR